MTLLHLGTLENTSALCLGAILKSNHQQKAQGCEERGIKTTVKRTLVYES